MNIGNVIRGARIGALLSIGASILFLSASTVEAERVLQAEGLSVGESFVNPLGYDLADMSFSWRLPLLKNSTAQTAYRLVVAESEIGLDLLPLWDSGRVAGSKSVKVPYAGVDFKSGKKYFWKVKVWDESGAESDWSPVASFETGLLKNSDWQAEWISTSEPAREMKAEWNVAQKGYKPTYLRKKFDLKDDIMSARLYVSCRGIFQVYANGVKIGKDHWGTGWTDYNKRIQSNTYDITAHLKSAKGNVLAATVADGWYAGRLTWIDNRRNFYGEKPEFIARLEVIYKDGSKDVVVSDSSWKCSYGPLTYADIYNGEEYDARLEQKNWSGVDFDDSSWKNVAASALGDYPLLEPRRNQPIVQKDVLVPLSVNHIGGGKYVFDFGQNMVGTVRIKVKGVGGLKVRIRYAEMLNKDGTLYTESYRSARSIDFYTCKGEGIEEWQPEFTYHGFRYIEVLGLGRDIKPTLDSVRGVVLYNDMPLTGSFVCSSSKINKLQSCIQWGQRGNFFSTPTDCPQRDERLGWTGDAQVFAPTAAFNMDVSAFFSKWNRDLRDAQTPAGELPHVAPNILGAGGSPAWADAGVIIPWEMYLAYGDKKALSENFDMMKRWVDYQKNTSQKLLRPESGFGDWLQPNPQSGNHPKSDAPKSLIGTAYFARTALITAKTAKILGDNAAEKKYSKLSEDVKSAFVKAFVSEDGKVKSDCQTAYLLALGFDILPQDLRSKAFAQLLRVLERDKLHLNTGFVGTPLLNEVLTRFGRADLAYKLLLNETYPSWLYPINQGGTTMWERWNSYSHENGFGDKNMNSFNHYAYGAIGQWLYKTVAGLWYDENAAGYKNIKFAPIFGGGLTFASATHQTPYGEASSSWNIDGENVVWRILIPANATGTIVLPTEKLDSVKIEGASANLSSKILHLDSGFYTLTFKK